MNKTIKKGVWDTMFRMISKFKEIQQEKDAQFYPKQDCLRVVLDFIIQALKIMIMSSTVVAEGATEPDVEVDNGKIKLRKLLNQNFRIEMTDGRVLIGVFLCTDRDANVILGACSEYLKNTDGETEEPRVLGLVMVPGRHIVSIQLDDTTSEPKFYNTL